MKLKYLSWLNQLDWYSGFVSGVAKVLPGDGLLKRTLDGIPSFMEGASTLAHFFAVEDTSGWTIYRNVEALRSGVTRYGKLVVDFNGIYRSQFQVWQLDEHFVTWSTSADMDPGHLRTVSELSDLASSVLSHVIGELGPDSRIRICESGFYADDEAAPATMTSVIEELCHQLRDELKCHGRTVLIHGPPGGGKTSASRQLVETLVETTMVVDSGSLGSGTNIFDLLVIWRPSAVVFDDVDHAIHSGRVTTDCLIAGIDRVRRVVPLVITTANDLSVFNGASMRPQRLADRILHVETLDRSIALSMLNHTPAHIAEQALEAGLLASYLGELDFRSKCRTGDPVAVLAEMIERQREAGDGLRADFQLPAPARIRHAKP